MPKPPNPPLVNPTPVCNPAGLRLSDRIDIPLSVPAVMDDRPAICRAQDLIDFVKTAYECGPLMGAVAGT